MGWIYIPTERDLEVSLAYAERIPENKTRGMRKDGTRGNEYNDVLGALAELTVSRWLGIDYSPSEDRKNEVDILIDGTGIEVRSSADDISPKSGRFTRLKVLASDRPKFGSFFPLYAYVTGDVTEMVLHGFYSPDWDELSKRSSSFAERTGWWIDRDELVI